MRQEPAATAVFKTIVTENSALTYSFPKEKERKRASSIGRDDAKARNDAWSEVSRDDEMHSKESVKDHHSPWDFDGLIDERNS
jgi:hypothetical protein